MIITILSDLNWESHLRSITEREIINFEKSHLNITRYDSLRRYYSIIKEEQSDLVLFAGDLTGDGSCGHGFHLAFILLLKLLESDSIPSAYISGNHDKDEYYDRVNKYAEQLQYTQEISNRCIDILGIKILGINYHQSKSKTQLKKIISQAKEKYDILLSHSQLKRRIRLFEIDTDYIFTGHYDRKLLYHRRSTYVSLDNDAYEISYAIIEKTENQSDKISIKIKESEEVTLSLVEEIEKLKSGNRTDKIAINGIPTIEISPLEKANLNALTDGTRDYSYLKYIRGHAYQKYLVSMEKMKEKKELTDFELGLNDILKMQIINNYKISERMIEDYLGNVL